MAVQTFLNVPQKRSDDPVNAVIYARYSSHSQGEQSIEGQLSAGHAYAVGKGYTVVHEYIDRATTGRNDNRDAFQQMLSDTAKRQFSVVIVWKVDRFGRNREEIAFNKHTCRKNGVRVEYVAENLPDSPESVILESVLEGMAEYYSLQLSQNILRGRLESANKGQCLGGTIPLGYRVNRETKKFESDPDTAPVVRDIFDMYANGYTIKEISDELNARGVYTTRKKPFTKNSLTSLLKNEKYIGIYTYKDVVRIEGGIPALVDKDTFAKVQELLKINRRAPSHTWTRFEYLLSEKLFCGYCGSQMVGESGFSHTGAKYSYYSCMKRRKEKACHKKPVRQDVIEKLVLEETYTVLRDEALLSFIADKTWEYYQAQNVANEKRAVLEAQLKSVQTSLDNLVRAIEAGIFNSATKDRMDELDGQKKALAGAIADLEISAGFQLTRDHILFFLHQFRDADPTNKDCQKRLISTFVNSVFVYDDKIKIAYNYSGSANTVTVEYIDGSEQGAGFVCCASCSTMTHRYEPLEITIRGSVFVLTIKLLEA